MTVQCSIVETSWKLFEEKIHFGGQPAVDWCKRTGGGVTGAGGRTVLCRPPSESRATALEGVEERFMKKRENDFSNRHQFYSYLV